ncbi:hypothetical protein ACB092_12G188800, partial [Castanea dentata]
VLHYVPVTKRKEGQSPFLGDKESISKDLQGLNLPVTKIIKPKSSSQPLKGFTRPSQGPIVEHGTLSTKRTEEGFDPNAYRLMAKAGYNHEKPTGLGKDVDETLLMDQDSNESPIEDDAEDAPPTFEEGVQATVDELKEVNIGATEDHRPVFINANLSLEEEDAYVELLKEYRDVFAWTYKEMPGLDPKVVVH